MTIANSVEMTEVDALETAHIDLERVRRRLDDGAMPDDVNRMVIGIVLGRIRRMEDEGAYDRAVEASRRRITAPTHSEQLVARTMGIIRAALPALPPEDSRALLLWLTGSPPEAPGFLQPMINTLNETSGAGALEKAQGQVRGILDRMHKVDNDLFNGRLDSLTSVQKNLIRGELLDAQWAFQQRDGVTARNHIIFARKLAIRWLRQGGKKK